MLPILRTPAASYSLWLMVPIALAACSSEPYIPPEPTSTDKNFQLRSLRLGAELSDVTDTTYDCFAISTITRCRFGRLEEQEIAGLIVQTAGSFAGHTVQNSAVDFEEGRFARIRLDFGSLWNSEEDEGDYYGLVSALEEAYGPTCDTRTFNEKIPKPFDYSVVFSTYIWCFRDGKLRVVAPSKREGGPKSFISGSVTLEFPWSAPTEPSPFTPETL